jgi:OmpA-OmpF porin, OOP family
MKEKVMRLIQSTLAGLCCLVAFGMLASQASAADETAPKETILYGSGQKPSDDELRMILFGDPNGIELQTRGIVMRETTSSVASLANTSISPVTPSAALEAAEAKPVTFPAPNAAPAQTERKATARSVAFNIEFGFNSAELTRTYDDQLSALALALKSSDAAGKTVMIIGHTDTIGTPEYNEELSLRRAMATREVLIKKFHVPAARLAPIGRGMSAPLAGLPGDAPKNRRVEFQTVS